MRMKWAGTQAPALDTLRDGARDPSCFIAQARHPLPLASGTSPIYTCLWWQPEVVAMGETATILAGFPRATILKSSDFTSQPFRWSFSAFAHVRCGNPSQRGRSSDLSVLDNKSSTVITRFMPPSRMLGVVFTLRGTCIVSNDKN
jgi:hypothetical protein